MGLGGLLGGQDDRLKRSKRFSQPNEMVVEKLRCSRTLFDVAFEALKGAQKKWKEMYRNVVSKPRS